MKKRLIMIIVFGIVAFAAMCGVAFSSARSFAATAAMNKLPYAKGQRFLVTQGYNTLPTHIKKDLYALDFTQNGCDAYGKAVLATVSGTAMFVSQEGYNGGYGTELIIDHGNNIVSRYAHLVPDSIAVAASGAVRQGQMVGLLGDTGLVIGAACAEHPGTHLHFAMDIVNDDGTFTAFDPEPISGFTDMTAGKWYVSDNGEDSDSATEGAVLGAYIAVATNTDPIAQPSSTLPVTNTFFGGGGGNSGGGSVVAIAVSADTSAAIEETSTPTSTDGVVASSAPSSTVTSTTSVASTTDASSMPSSTVDIGVSSSTPTSTDANPILFSQADDSSRSSPSWYGDNWFELGSGFSGTLNALTLEGAVSDVRYGASHIALQEFKDKNYAALVQQFPISDAAPFTSDMATATFSGFSISLKPYFYYRLSTGQDLQNRSVILAGTATTTIGTVMWNGFTYGVGRVEYTAPFFPFMEMDGVAATSTSMPPLITAPTNLVETFDGLAMRLDLSWSTSTDSDWPANPLRYEMNYSTSTSLSDTGWTDPGAISVTVGNSYLIGVRAKDNYGDISAIATTTWDFPSGFVQYFVSPEISYASQYFTVSSTSTLQSIALFTENAQTSARYMESMGCYMELFDSYHQSSIGMTQSDNGFSGYGCAGTPTFFFSSSSLVLYPDHLYHWVFVATTGNPSTGASVQFYGTATNTAGGLFSNPSLVNARFTMIGDTGVLFSN